MQLNLEGVKKLTLETLVYHPVHGKGSIIQLKKDRIEVRFANTYRTFHSSGDTATTNFISELYLKPIKIVCDE